MAKKLLIEIVGDSRSYERALNKSATSTKQFGQAMGQTSPKLGKLSNTLAFTGTSAALLTGAATGLAFKLGGDAVTAASDLNEQISRTEVVLGKAAPEMIAWSETTAQAMGISQRAALAATGTFSGLFQTVGVARPEAAKLSRSLVQLAADLASLQNSSPEEALIALRSGLAGEAEPLRRFNIFLTEARVQQQALIETGKENVRSLTQQEKTTARYNIIMKDSATAQGNFALTSGELANQQRIAKAEMDNLSASVGQVLVPAMQAAVTTIGLFAGSLNDVIGAMGSFKKALSDTSVFDGWNSAVEGANESTTGFFENLASGIPGMERFLDLRDRIVGGGVAPTPFPARPEEGAAGQSRAERNAADAAAKAERDRANAIINGITKRAAAQGNYNIQLANSEKRAAHLRDLIRADPNNAKLQKRLTDELTKQAGLRKQIAAAAEAQVAADEAAAKAAQDATLALLDLAEARASLTKGLQDDLAAAKSRESTLRKLVALSRDDLDLANQLVQATLARRDIEQQINEAREARVKSAQFKELGLTPEGDKPTPGAGSLLKRATTLQEQIKGTILDTPKTRNQLKKIVAYLRKHLGDAKKDVRAAVLEMLNGIADGFDEKKGPLTKTSGLSMKVLEGMGLSPEEERELRRRLSSVNSAGRQLAAGSAGGRTQQTIREGGFGNNPIFVESHTTINLDGQTVAKVVTKQQQKTGRRNPPQKRGPTARAGR